MRTDYSMWGGKPRQSLQILEMIAAHGDSDECLLWPYRCRKDGYGDVQHEKKRWRVTRLTWLLVYGSLDETLFILHSCDNPPCFNPKHLFQGTQDDNMKDMRKKNRWKSVNPTNGADHHSHKLSADEVVEIRSRYRPGILQVHLAKEFGVSQSAISGLLLRKTWKHVK